MLKWADNFSQFYRVKLANCYRVVGMTAINLSNEKLFDLKINYHEGPSELVF